MRVRAPRIIESAYGPYAERHSRVAVWKAVGLDLWVVERIRPRDRETKLCKSFEDAWQVIDEQEAREQLRSWGWDEEIIKDYLEVVRDERAFNA